MCDEHGILDMMHLHVDQFVAKSIRGKRGALSTIAKRETVEKVSRNQLRKLQEVPKRVEGVCRRGVA